MWSSTSTCSSALALALALLASAPREAAAQACCGGPTAFAPARLAPHEDALVGLQLKASDAFGSFDVARRFHPAPAGSAEIDLEQDVVAAFRVLRWAQVSVLLPMVETYRRVPGISEASGDLGDLQLGARWDFLVAGEHAKIPGIALLFGATLPTGRTPEAAQKPLATDATGTGSVQLSPALALEQAWGPILVDVTGSIAWRSPRSVGTVHAQQGLTATASLSAAYVFPKQAVLALSASYSAELDARIDGVTVPGSGRAATRLGLAGGVPFPGGWRLQGTVFSDLPLRFLGYNQPAAAGITFMFVRGFS